MIYENTTIIDFETTGFDPNNDKIIEVALLRIRKGKIIGSLTHLINPEIDIPSEITKITGITNGDVDYCPKIYQILPWLMAIIGDSIIVAHNALFDLNFLEVQNQKYRGKGIKNFFLDTRAISIDRFPYESHRLEAMCKKYGIHLIGAHRANNDVQATWELLKKLNDDMTIDIDYLNKIYYYKKHGMPEWYPDYAKVIGI